METIGKFRWKMLVKSIIYVHVCVYIQLYTFYILGKLEHGSGDKPGIVMASSPEMAWCLLCLISELKLKIYTQK